MKCLVIVLDSCQPAYLGCYGNDWLPTPTLDQLAAQGIVFDQFYAAEVAPRSVRWNWLTGRWACAQRDAALHRLPELFWDHGIPTVLIGDEHSPSTHRLGSAGWEQQHWIRQERLKLLEQESLLGGTVQTAIEWLKGNLGLENWLLWLELGALLPPWDPAHFDGEALEGLDDAELEPLFEPGAGPLTPADLERSAATYAGVMSGVDQWLGMLIGQLGQLGLLDDMIIVLTSDRGLPLGEHGVLGATPPNLYQELVHMPLLLRLPKAHEAGRRVQQLAQPVDLLPTLLDAFSLPAPPKTQGRSLLSLARGEITPRRDYVCISSRSEWAIRTHGWHLRLAEHGAQLFIKPEDRWEVNDVAGQHPDVVEHLELTLRRFRDCLARDRLDQAPELRHEILMLQPN